MKKGGFLDNDGSDVAESSGRPLIHTLKSFPRGAIEKVLLLDRLNKIHMGIANSDNPSIFLENLLKVLGIRYDIPESDRMRIPREGPVLVVCNHPFGGLDGIILSSILLSARGDVKVMANYMLKAIPDLNDIFIFVDPFGRKDSVRDNMRPVRELMTWLRKGKMACIFPAGEVSHMQITKGRITDPRWTYMIARIIRKTGCSVLPACFTGANSALFQLAGLVHPRLRTIMLPREILNKSKKMMRLRIGTPISFDKLGRFENDDDLMRYLRMRTYILGSSGKKATRAGFFKRKRLRGRAQARVIEPVAKELLLGDLDRLPPAQLLVDNDRFAVYEASFEQIPNMMKEIGRLREVTFRDEGEGTGKEIDTDSFDTYYRHLFLWNREEVELVGAYRLGLADTILSTYGKKGLYTHSLFNYGRQFLKMSSPAIELGRSFVRMEYQKTYHPLMLLWKGIARFVSEHPKYRVLFGPVSITNDYNTISRQLIVEFLRAHNRHEDLAGMVKARTPMKKRLSRGNGIKTALTMLDDIQGLSELISEIEEDQKGIPILLKHYVRLGGKILEFNVDKDFSDALDALIYVDLAETDKRLLERYMGKERADRFLRSHSGDELAECA